MSKQTVRHLIAQAAFYLEVEQFNPHDFDQVSGEIVIRTHGIEDRKIPFHLEWGGGHVSFPGPTHPNGSESSFVSAFVSSLERMWDEVEENNDN